jgi:hypothetical protein
MTTFFSSRSLHGAALVLLLLFSAAAPAQEKPAPNREQLERKLTSTSTLIESSSGAKQIESSGVAGATAQRNRARDLHRQAGEALRAGQLEAASKLLDESSRAMFDGVRLSAPEQISAPKQRTDFDVRMASTRALLDAQKRIAAEKNAGPRAGELSQRIESLIAQADEMARGGRMADARRTLDDAYMAVRAAIGGMRGGETVVRSLNFANKEEEYRYEVDRNDTHRMLVQVLLKDKRGAAGVDAMVDQSLVASAKLRTQADEQASRREHEAAVKTLEESTRELVKAIRGAGVYIPG